MPINEIFELRKNKAALLEYAKTLIENGLRGDVETLADDIQAALYEQCTDSARNA